MRRFTSLLLLALVFGAAGQASAAQGPWVLPAANLSEAGRDSDGSQVETGPDGTTAAVWQRFDGSNWIVQAATRLPGESFGQPVSLSEPGQDGLDPQVGISPDGTITVAWSRTDDLGATVQAAVRPPGGSFGQPVNLSEPSENASNQQVSAGPDGTTTVVWRRFDGENRIIQASSRPSGGSFGSPVNLSEPGRNGDVPQVDTGADGTTTVVWRRFDGANWRAQASTRPAGGSFGPAANLSEPGQNAFAPQVSTAPDGAATAVWYRSDSSNLIVQAASRPAAGNFAAAVDLSQPGQNANDPQVGTGPDGTVTAVWRRFNGSNRIVQAASKPASGSFGSTTDLSESGQDALYPQIDVGPDGAATVVWQRSDDSNSRVHASSRLPGGAFGPVVTLSEAGQHASHPQVSVASAATSVVWTRSNGSNEIVQAASTEWVYFGLEVGKGGDGSGVVKSAPTGIDCGAVCSKEFLSGTKVILTATPANGSTFAGWSGACTGAKSSCEVRLDEARQTTAKFTMSKPTATTAVFDGKYLYIRLKCAARFKPGCRGFAQAVTKKRKGKAMSSRASAAQKAGRWKIVKLAVKPSFKAKVAAMGKQPTKKLLVVKSVVSAKKYKHGKKFTVFHSYKVRTAG